MSEGIILGDSDPRLRHIMDENGYKLGTMIPGTEDYAVVCEFMFTGGILRGNVNHADMGYTERWCYHPKGAEIAALIMWRSQECEGEPTGWHRHLPSNRRRVEGDPATEEVRA